MPDGTVFQIVSDGAGNLYAGGTFTSASGTASTRNIAKWDGTAWTALGAGVTASGPNGQYSGVFAVGVDTVSDPDVVYIGGDFSQVAGTSMNRLAKWTGTGWSVLGATGDTNNGVNNPTNTWDGVEEIVVKSPTEVFVGGYFDNAFDASGSVSSTDGIAMYDGASLSAVGAGIGGGDAIVNGMTLAGSNIIAAGQFTKVNGSANDALRVAEWNGSTWSGFGSSPDDSGPDALVGAVAVNGGDVYIGGLFSEVTNETTPVSNTNRLAKWDVTSSAWTSIGEVDGVVVEELRVINHGGTKYLYAGGEFDSIGGVEAFNIARLNLDEPGATWEPLLSGCRNSENGVNGAVRSIIDAGDGAIYVGGRFTDAGDVPAADRIAKFNPGAEADCAGGGINFNPAPVTIAGPTNFRITQVRDSVRLDGGRRYGLGVTLAWDGAPAYHGYLVSVERVRWTEPRTRGGRWSLDNVNLITGLACYSEQSSCEIIMPYSVFGGFGLSESRFVLKGVSASGRGREVVLDPPRPDKVKRASAPLDVKIETWRDKVTVSWSPPESPGSYPIQFYIANTTTAPFNSCPSTKTSCTFTVAPGVPVAFRVTAVTAAGSGDPVITSPVIPPNVSITSQSRRKVSFLFFNRGSDISVEGTAPGIPVGSVLKAFVMFNNSGQWVPAGETTVQANGKFSWKRRFPTSQNRDTIAVTFTYGDKQGDVVYLGPVG
jgi:hypothetical protein